MIAKMKVSIIQTKLLKQSKLITFLFDATNQ